MKYHVDKTHTLGFSQSKLYSANMAFNAKSELKLPAVDINFDN